MKHNAKIFIIFLLINILINVFLINFLSKPKRIATLDLQNIKNGYVRLIVDKSTGEKEKYINDFSVKINKLISQVSKENNLIIIPKQAVFDGEDIDLTNQFRRILLHDIKQD